MKHVMQVYNERVRGGGGGGREVKISKKRAGFLTRKYNRKAADSQIQRIT